jgi:glutaredoxin
MDMDPAGRQFVLYKKPGWSSCLRAKEFLSQTGVDFIVVDILNDQQGFERLLELGVRHVPVVANGKQFVFGQNLQIVAEFVGVRSSRHTALPPDVLIRKWTNILRAAQRYVRQIPGARMHERAVENRDRSIRLLSHHVFRVAEAFLESVVDGVEYSAGLDDLPPQGGACTTGDEIARYGDGVVERLQDWGNQFPGGSSRTVQTFYGPQTVHELLERSAWHSAQHARQLIHVLGRYGITPDGPLAESDLAGLPLPTGLFD